MAETHYDIRRDKCHQSNYNNDDHISTVLLHEILLPLYGPHLPHPSNYLIADEGNNNDKNVNLLEDQIFRLMASYSVDMNRGFLPSIDPLHQLPLDGKFGCWESIMMDLSQYLQAKNIRAVILSRLQAVEIESNDLLDERELQRALLVLAVLSHAFVWGEKPISSFIPACLAIPWVTLAKRTCRPPILTHSLLVLANWKRFDLEKSIESGNIAMLNGFLSGTDEANFYLVTVELEYRGAKALKHMLRAQYFASMGKMKDVINELKNIETIQKTMLNTLSKMYDEVDPYIFYRRVRHFLAGWKGNPSLPNGMLYEGVSETRQFLHGASAAQSSLIAAFDVFFGITHDSKHTHEFIKEMRYYMPPRHRQFLEMLAKNNDSMSNIVKQPSTCNEEQEHKELLCAYNACIDQLVAFRNAHIKIVALYILSQIQKDSNIDILSTVSNATERNGNKSNESKYDVNETTSSARGTGGTILMPFLKTCRDETILQRLT